MSKKVVKQCQHKGEDCLMLTPIGTCSGLTNTIGSDRRCAFYKCKNEIPPAEILKYHIGCKFGFFPEPKGVITWSRS